MKTVSNRFRILIATATMGALLASASAGPGLQYWKSLGSDSQFKQLKSGESVVYTCIECKSLSEVKIKSQEHAMEICKLGSTVTCPSCKMETKVVRKTQRNQAGTHTEIIYVNGKGEECAFFAKTTDKK